ncbi:MAG: hypothetical protein WCE23_17245, partial [Candidatus Binatus sp.]|uniref:hypothetical protein n=1 Tax=Candidatus Binatus sp. TaxID=2811406 RepID=UPI003C77E45C
HQGRLATCQPPTTCRIAPPLLDFHAPLTKHMPLNCLCRASLDLFGYVSDDPINRRDQDGKGLVVGTVVAGVCGIVLAYQAISSLYEAGQLANQPQQTPDQQGVEPGNGGGQCKKQSTGGDDFPDFNRLNQQLAPIGSYVQNHSGDSISGTAVDILCGAAIPVGFFSNPW